MEEELNYVAVNFIKRDASPPETQPKSEQIYDEVKTETQRCEPKKEQDCKEAVHRSHLRCWVFWGIICLVLISTITAISIHFQSILSELHTVNDNLTAENDLLLEEKMRVLNRAVELTRERDRLNRNMGFILEFDNFPVHAFCPQKVCRPCLDGWILFQSKCYLFVYEWKSWSSSQDYCRGFNAHLAVIDSEEEQGFLSNQSKGYYDEFHGYWIGLSQQPETNKWTWVDGSNTSVTHWATDQPESEACVLLMPKYPPQANWRRTYCYMRNRWICEMKSLIMPEEGTRVP